MVETDRKRAELTCFDRRAPIGGERFRQIQIAPGDLNGYFPDGHYAQQDSTSGTSHSLTRLGTKLRVSQQTPQESVSVQEQTHQSIIPKSRSRSSGSGASKLSGTTNFPFH